MNPKTRIFPTLTLFKNLDFRSPLGTPGFQENSILFRDFGFDSTHEIESAERRNLFYCSQNEVLLLRDLISKKAIEGQDQRHQTLDHQI